MNVLLIRSTTSESSSYPLVLTWQEGRVLDLIQLENFQDNYETGPAVCSVVKRSLLIKKSQVRFPSLAWLFLQQINIPRCIQTGYFNVSLFLYMFCHLLSSEKTLHSADHRSGQSPQLYLCSYVIHICCHGAMGCGQKSFKLVWRCHLLLFGLLAKEHLPRVSSHSRLSVNDMDDNEMIPGAVHRAPGIQLRLRKVPEICSQETVCRRLQLVIASNGVAYVQTRSVGTHITSGREKEGNEERIVVGSLDGNGRKDGKDHIFHGAIGYGQKRFKLVFALPPTHVCQLMIQAIMRRYRGCVQIFTSNLKETCGPQKPLPQSICL